MSSSHARRWNVVDEYLLCLSLYVFTNMIYLFFLEYVVFVRWFDCILFLSTIAMIFTEIEDEQLHY